jgi:glutaredoxin-like YruB-family protein
MEFIPVKRKEEIKADKDGKALVLFHKPGTPNSDCAYDNLARVKQAKVYTVDVNEVKDLHQAYGVNSVPSLVIINKGKVQNIVKGCQTENYFSQLIHEETGLYSSGNGQPQKRVVVYTTPSCPYCNKIKEYLAKHGIKFNEIDVASNPAAAQEMVRKSGQRGVPQTEIAGQMIIGFDTQKLSRLLNIPTE